MWAVLATVVVGGAAVSAQQETALTEPDKAAVGEPAPDFTLRDAAGKEHRLSDHKGKIVVLEWFNPKCPYVVDQHENGPLKDMGNTIDAAEDVVWLAINSNYAGSQGSGQGENENAIRDWGIRYPLLFDADGTVGRLYQAKTTPHMFVINPEGVLVYEGAIDNAPMGKVRGGGERINYVEEAINAVRNGSEVEQANTRPYGCSVKYKD